MRKSNFALRLQPSLLEELRKVAESEGVALNQLINVAVAEKVSALRTEEYFQQRAHRANRAETLRILEKAGKGQETVRGDELPSEWPKSTGVVGRAERKKYARSETAKSSRKRLRTR